MSNRILPVIGSKGTYELLPPFDSKILSEELYTCKAIRNISEYVSYNQDVKKLVYEYYKLTEEDYENDIKEDMEIVSLQNNKGVWVYVPARFIIKYPTTDGVPYHQVSVVCKLPAIEVEKDLEFLKDNINNLLKDTLGFEASISIIESSRIIAVTKQVADKLKIERAALSKGKVTDRARYTELLQKYQILLDNIKLLEEYIKKMNGVFRLDGPNYVIKNAVVPYRIIGYDAHATYTAKVDIGEVEVNDKYVIYTAPNEVTVATITVNDIDFIVHITEELPNIATPVINLLNEDEFIGPDVGFLTNTFSTLFMEDDHVSTDWEVATDAEFTNVISSISNSTVYKTYYLVTDLQPNTTYYVRAKFHGSVLTSNWGVLPFTTRTSFIDKPVIVQPSNHSDNLGPDITFTSNEFSLLYGTDTHKASQWQISTDSDFKTIVADTEQTSVDLTSFTVRYLLANRTYYARVRYLGYIKGPSEWSDTLHFSTLSTYVTTPVVVSPVTNSKNLGPLVELVSSNFKTIAFSDEHINSDWQVATDALFTNIVFEKTNEVSGKIQLYTDRLNSNKTYFVRVRHTSEKNGTSAWSPVVTFSTRASYIDKPFIINPISNTENLGPVINFNSTVFKTDDSDTHVSSTWEVSTDENFSEIVHGSLDNANDKITFNVKNIAANTKYYTRVKYKGSSGDWSEWSDITYFFTHGSYITTPKIETPLYGQISLGRDVTLVSSEFESIANQSHAYSDWQISTSKTFNTGTSEVNSPFLTKFVAKNLSPGTVYYARVRYCSNTELKSQWSSVLEFTTSNNFIEKPSITVPIHGDDKQYDNICFKSTPFKAFSSSSHASSTWSIRKKTGASTTTTVINDVESTEFLTQFNLINAEFNTTYLIRVKYKDDSGYSSDWSESSVFVTRPDFATSPEYDVPAMT